ncbi:MAG TPA: hypothetical protein VJT73_07000, partial [Polyangiaceae bacterium]|nr:hypothetical protein [Polyangiaceae bacterium]
MSRGALFAISIVAHLGLAIGLGQIKRPLARAATSITMSEAKKKPDPPKPAEAPPPPPKEPPPRATQKAKAAPASAKAEPEAAPPPPSSNPAAAGGGSLDGLADFGLSLSGGTGPGLAVPASQPGAGTRPAPLEKVVKKPLALAPKPDTCDDPVVKPKPKNVPTPAYTEAGR